MKSLKSEKRSFLSQDINECYFLNIQSNINIMQQKSVAEEEGYEFFITQDPQQPIKINKLVERLKPQSSIQHITTIQLNDKKAQLQYSFSREKKSISKIFVSLNIKNRILEIECILMLKKFQVKWLSKKLPQVIAKANDRKKYSTHALTIRYENERKSLNIQTFQSLQQIISINSLINRITKRIQECYNIMEQIFSALTHKKSECEMKYDQDLLKQQDKIEENRWRREKSTKISLHSQFNIPIESKIVQHYLLDHQKMRTLYAKYKIHKQMLDKKLENTPATSSSGQSQGIKKYKNTVLKGILLEKQTEIEQMTPGGFGYTFKIQCQYSQLQTVCQEAQQQIDALMRKDNHEPHKVRTSDILIKKIPNNEVDGGLSFKNELNYLYMMRDLQCAQIAEYFRVCELNSNQTHADSQADADSFSNSKSLYSKYYPYQLSHIYCKNVDLRLKIMIDLFQGISFLEKHDLLHRDIKPQNLRVSNKSQIKIIDFGSANFNYRKIELGSKSELFGRTAKYFLSYDRANLFNSNISTLEYYRTVYYDMYACGIIVSEMFQSELDPPFIYKHTKYISQKCMEKNPYDRISPQECVKYLSKILKVQKFISEI